MRWGRAESRCCGMLPGSWRSRGDMQSGNWEAGRREQQQDIRASRGWSGLEGLHHCAFHPRHQGGLRTMERAPENPWRVLGAHLSCGAGVSGQHALHPIPGCRRMLKKAETKFPPHLGAPPFSPVPPGTVWVPPTSLSLLLFRAKRMTSLNLSSTST